MQFIETENALKLVIDNDGEQEALIDYHVEGTLGLDESMYEFFEPILANSHFRWIDPEEIGALTSAPILGYENENESIVEAYGFMNYCVQSLLEELFIHNEVGLVKG